MSAQILSRYRRAVLVDDWPADDLFIEFATLISDTERKLERADSERRLAAMMEAGAAGAVKSLL